MKYLPPSSSVHIFLLSLFPTNNSEAIDIYVQKNEVGIPLHTIYKNQPKMCDKLKLRIKTLKISEANTDVVLHDPGLDNDFLDMTLKAQVTKEKN
jgi:hypothetical protein